MTESQPNPPEWPGSVFIFDPSTPDLQEEVLRATEGLRDRSGHFSAKRVALLFKPGTYNLDVEVGYYTHVAGLGRAAEEVVFTGEGNKSGVFCRAADPEKAGSLDTFWRSAENFRHSASLPESGGSPGMMWAVSQGTQHYPRHLPVLIKHISGTLASGESRQRFAPLR